MSDPTVEVDYSKISAQIFPASVASRHPRRHANPPANKPSATATVGFYSHRFIRPWKSIRGSSVSWRDERRSSSDIGSAGVRQVEECGTRVTRDDLMRKMFATDAGLPADETFILERAPFCDPADRLPSIPRRVSDRPPSFLDLGALPRPRTTKCFLPSSRGGPRSIKTPAEWAFNIFPKLLPGNSI